jgi:release factor glutamine methyltransferase
MPTAAVPVTASDAVNASTIDGARRAWAARFRAGGIDSPDLDARILVGHALSLDHAALAASGACSLSPAEASAIAALAQRRLGHEPVARILGIKEFWSLNLRVDDATLVPRPETETIVTAALAAVAARRPRRQTLRIADLGTGSGAILLAVLNELPNAFGVGTDVSSRALAIARDNAQRLGLSRVAFVACDMASALRAPFDVIMSNPPYVASGDLATLPPDVRLFDPRLALDGGPDGLRFYRTIAAAAPTLLAPDGVLVVELGAGQAEPVAALFAAAGLAPLPARPDLNGVPRALVASNCR